jgi:hypothetical protein
VQVDPLRKCFLQCTSQVLGENNPNERKRFHEQPLSHLYHTLSKAPVDSPCIEAVKPT